MLEAVESRSGLFASPPQEPKVCRLTAGASRIRTSSPTVVFAVARAGRETISIGAADSPSLLEGDQRFESAFLQRRIKETCCKRHEMPAHHKLEAYLDEYLDATGIRGAGRTPLFRSTIGKMGILPGLPMHRVDVWRMIRRRPADASLRAKIGCHTFRATGITA